MASVHIVYGVPVAKVDYLEIAPKYAKEDLSTEGYPSFKAYISTKGEVLTGYVVPKPLGHKLEYLQKGKSEYVVIGVCAINTDKTLEGYLFNDVFVYDPSVISDAKSKYDELLTDMRNDNNPLLRLLEGKNGKVYAFNLY